ncbi:lytic polysaccharide monooxygenase [Myxococcota bacterium]|nr:lytic polysaccharide monooxygenase [Myxococcota bacterium]
MTTHLRVPRAPFPSLLVFALALGVARDAAAHIHLDAPIARGSDQKEGPCGRAGGTRTTNVTTFRPGETITVSWRETIDHPGHYRIAFDADGVDDLVDPASYDDRYTNAAVLLDGIPNEDDHEYSVEVTLPDVECSNCTLQLVQVMTDKAPYVIGTNDLYYQCADLVLAADGTTPPPVTTQPGGGCVAVPGELGDVAPWLGLAAVIVTWRSRRGRRPSRAAAGSADTRSTT